MTEDPAKKKAKALKMLEAIKEAGIDTSGKEPKPKPPELVPGEYVFFHSNVSLPPGINLQPGQGGPYISASQGPKIEFIKPDSQKVFEEVQTYLGTQIKVMTQALALPGLTQVDKAKLQGYGFALKDMADHLNAQALNKAWTPLPKPKPKKSGEHRKTSSAYVMELTKALQKEKKKTANLKALMLQKQDDDLKLLNKVNALKESGVDSYAIVKEYKLPSTGMLKARISLLQKLLSEMD